MPKDRRRTGFGSTEPQARKVVEQIQATTQARPPTSTPDTGGKTTAQMPKGVQKSEKMAKQDKEKIRKSVEARVKQAKEKEKRAKK